MLQNFIICFRLVWSPACMSAFHSTLRLLCDISKFITFQMVRASHTLPFESSGLFRRTFVHPGRPLHLLHLSYRKTWVGVLIKVCFLALNFGTYPSVSISIQQKCSLKESLKRRPTEPDEGKSSAFPRELVFGDENVPDLSVLLKQVLYVVSTRSVGQVIHLQRHHVWGVWRGAPSISRHPEDSSDDITLK